MQRHRANVNVQLAATALLDASHVTLGQNSELADVMTHAVPLMMLSKMRRHGGQEAGMMSALGKWRRVKARDGIEPAKDDIAHRTLSHLCTAPRQKCAIQ